MGRVKGLQSRRLGALDLAFGALDSEFRGLGFRMYSAVGVFVLSVYAEEVGLHPHVTQVVASVFGG